VIPRRLERTTISIYRLAGWALLFSIDEKSKQITN